MYDETLLISIALFPLFLFCFFSVSISISGPSLHTKFMCYLGMFLTDQTSFLQNKSTM